MVDSWTGGWERTVVSAPCRIIRGSSENGWGLESTEGCMSMRNVRSFKMTHDTVPFLFVGLIDAPGFIKRIRTSNSVSVSYNNTDRTKAD